MKNINEIRFGAVLSKILSDADMYNPDKSVTPKMNSYLDKQAAAASEKVKQIMAARETSTQPKPGMQMRS